ncbi:MAG TPA: GH3 auxin-responsive promoter family protein, partial [Phycisphaerales bacterium]|nr:GH3 auxin-responsive promoter family protein [Phycisphaerales bacterium]
MHPVAVRSHYFEFEDAAGVTRPLHELREGDLVTPILTTGGGLWRYRLPDRVVVDGFVERTPSIRFVGRLDAVTDLRGEKLSDAFVGGVLRSCEARLGLRLRRSVLVGRDSPIRAGYVWQVSEELPGAAAALLDGMLSENPHYAYARRLGQLEMVRVERTTEGSTSMAARSVRALGAVKPVSVCIQT